MLLSKDKYEKTYSQKHTLIYQEGIAFAEVSRTKKGCPNKLKLGLQDEVERRVV